MILLDFVTLALAKKYARQKIAELGNVLRFKGTKATYAEIEAIEDPQVGDVWHCIADGGEYAYTTSGTWTDLGNDLSGYLAKADLAKNVTGTSEETAPTQKAVHDAFAALVLGTVVLKATSSIGIASISTDIVLTGVDAANIISVRAYTVDGYGVQEDVIVKRSYNPTTKTLTCSSNGHASPVAIEVYYAEATPQSPA